MKSLSTLVKDIYAVLESGAARLDSDKLANMIRHRLEGVGESSVALRMSTLGEKCLRKLWYKENKPELAEPLPGRTLLNFLNGHIIEETVLSLAEQAGHTVEGRQDALDLHGVPGHRDAIIDGVVVDVKSANSRTFDKFKGHALERDDPFGYLEQINAYAEASKDDPRVIDKENVAFLAVDKELGHLKVDTYERKNKDWKHYIGRIRSLLGAATPPPRPYVAEPDGRSGNMQLPLPCRYCQYKHSCWQNLRTFIYANGPKYLTHVERTPEVPEQKGQEIQEQIRSSDSKKIREESPV